jgi:cyclohexa-1,5-dienecarbonyl-CoA hydratase
LPASDLPRKTNEVLSRLRELSATALEITHKAIDLGNNRTLDDALRDVEDIYLHELMKTSDANEGISAFMEKRKPVWRNR